MLLMIDNYDSFTWNLVQYLQTLGAEVKVVRNDELSVDQIDALQPERIVISPGPCTPNEAGVSVDVIRQLGARVPILGVCLGHQRLDFVDRQLVVAHDLHLSPQRLQVLHEVPGEAVVVVDHEEHDL